MRTSIGEFLFILRKSKGMTQQEVADRLGVSNKTVSSWETGASCPDICAESARPPDSPTTRQDGKRRSDVFLRNIKTLLFI